MCELFWDVAHTAVYVLWVTEDEHMLLAEM